MHIEMKFILPKIVKRLTLASAALALLLFVHILWVTQPSDAHHADIQLGRIDFPAALDAGQAGIALSALRGMDGIQTARLNRDSTSMVFAYPTGRLTHEAVAAHFGQSSRIAHSLFVPPPTAAAAGCPVLNKRSVLYRVSMYIHNLL